MSQTDSSALEQGPSADSAPAGGRSRQAPTRGETAVAAAVAAVVLPAAAKAQVQVHSPKVPATDVPPQQAQQPVEPAVEQSPQAPMPYPWRRHWWPVSSEEMLHRDRPQVRPCVATAAPP